MGRIVHFGLGNFARAHLLDYTSDAGGWDVIGVSLRSTSARDGLAPQHFNYKLNVQGKDLKSIQVLVDILVASEGPEAILGPMPWLKTASPLISSSQSPSLNWKRASLKSSLLCE